MSRDAPSDAGDVLAADESDLREAVSHALSRAGCTFVELAKQARAGRFASVRARLAWVAIGDLGGLAPPTGPEHPDVA